MFTGYAQLHDYSFFGKNPRIGTASDWVWFNVPHGPQKQIDCFLHAYECCKMGLEEVSMYQRLQKSGGKPPAVLVSRSHNLKGATFRYCSWMCAGVQMSDEAHTLLGLQGRESEPFQRRWYEGGPSSQEIHHGVDHGS